ncbi:hypothetical protein [Candidatus Rhabdochlamydia porcellionis]|uniref:Uncharacterized protein n=1 Tax=Candidatus Rhabdochlamydia porcellionis TaxID=225148 RepID=A0ABX8Z4G0_9BACT|nr:hypothetical protein [Candidatus Rhabdochlamydia porcellionis]QZA59193.1 hypothetical protein RHAB15C_0001078 [Candidatus Rhabdochlamydia porcellionis]
MRIIGFIFMLFVWVNPLMSGVDVNIDSPPDSGYYYYDNDEGYYYWNGPGYYNGIWFDNEDNWHHYHGHGGGHYHRGHGGGHHH